MLVFVFSLWAQDDLPEPSAKSSFFELGISYLNASGEYSVWDPVAKKTEKFAVPVNGAEIEPFFGIRVPSFENLRFGFAPALTIAYGKTNMAYGGYAGEVETILLDLFLMFKYALGANLGPVYIEFVNAFGLSMAYDAAYGAWWEKADIENTREDFDSALEIPVKPAVEFGLDIRYKITGYSSLGLGFGVNVLLGEFDFGDSGSLSIPVAFNIGLRYVAHY